MSRLAAPGLALLLAAAAAFAAPAPAAADRPVDLELVLAIDSSASVDDAEFVLQTRGMARAFRDPDAIEAILSGPYRAIAVAVVEWASADFQVVDIPWTAIDSRAAALRVADRLDAMPRAIHTGATSISGALAFAAGMFADNGFRGVRQAIDLSCDGRNNQGVEVGPVRDAVVRRGVTINGLTILNEHPTLDIYFRRRIVGGDGAFVEAARDYSDFADAFLRKLVREARNIPIVEAPAPGRAHKAAAAAWAPWMAARRSRGERQSPTRWTGIPPSSPASASRAIRGVAYTTSSTPSIRSAAPE